MISCSYEDSLFKVFYYIFFVTINFYLGMKKQNVVILGSTGSIGVNTLKVIKQNQNCFNVIGLTAYSNIKKLNQQIVDFAPDYVAIPEKGRRLISGLRKHKILNVDVDLEFLVSLKNVDIVVIGMRGSVALGPFLAAVKAGKTVAPANKEALVIAGDLIMRVARRSGAKIIPVDSEQSAIFQCLEGQRREDLKKVYLTASGGALLNVSKSKFKGLTVKEILNHPRWKMGKKITVDSATLMNKGFEIIEAMRLFQLRAKDIEVVIHPEAVIHSMVEFIDGSIIAQMGIADMRLPIQYALTYPKRIKSPLKSVDFTEWGQFNFLKPDYKKFPALELCKYVAEKDGTLPSVLNASDEEAVEAFLMGTIRFIDIYDVVAKVVMKHKINIRPSLNDILSADSWAREETRKVIER